MPAAIVVLALVAAWVAPAGYLSVDEATYHLMVANVADGRPLEIWNGYEEQASPELVAASIVVRDGRLVAMPPPFYSWLALPFYLALGYRGLIVLNALAFVLTLWATAKLGERVTGDPMVGRIAAAVLGAATFLPAYAVAAWPHALTTLAVVGAFLALDAALAGDRRGAVAAGIFAGVACGLRLDAVFALAAALLVLLFARPARLRQAVWLLAGAAPPLIALGLANRLKFGTWSPFSYGHETAAQVSGAHQYVPILALALAGGVPLWWLSRTVALDRLRRHPRSAALAATGLAVVGLGAVLAFVPTARDAALRLVAGGYQLFVDLRVRDPSLASPAMTRGPGGSLVYLGGVKRALLQSCPYLVLLLVPLVEVARRRASPRLLVLFAVPGTYLGVYSFFAWHGGLSFNLRYLTPALPFAAIAVAWAWRRLLPAEEKPAGRPVAVVAGGLLAVAVLAVGLAAPSLAVQELLLATLPLLLALTLGLLAGARLAVSGGGLVAPSLRVALALALVFSTASLVAHDLPRAAAQRAFNHDQAERAAELLEDDALVVTPYTDAFWGAAQRLKLRVADPTRDEYADFRRLAGHHLAAGRPVYAALRPSIWEELERRGQLVGWRREVLWEEPEMMLARLGRLP